MQYYEYADEHQRGRIERFEYSYTNLDGKLVNKYANVYLPYGYDEKDSKTRYNILYLIHGGNGSQDAWWDSTYLKNMLDVMIAKGEIKPLILVTPTYYSYDRDGSFDFEGEQTKRFQEELTNTLIPALETKYHTFLENGSPEAISKSRMHRGISGFSMGGCTTWFAFTKNLKNIGWFVPLSGDSWEVELRGGQTQPEKTAELLVKVVKDAGYTAKDFYLFPCTGEGDIAYPNLTPQVEAMRKYPDIFVETDGNPEGNFHYLTEPERVHCYPDVSWFLYKTLPRLFK